MAEHERSLDEAPKPGASSNNDSVTPASIPAANFENSFTSEQGAAVAAETDSPSEIVNDQIHPIQPVKEDLPISTSVDVDKSSSTAVTAVAPVKTPSFDDTPTLTGPDAAAEDQSTKPYSRSSTAHDDFEEEPALLPLVTQDCSSVLLRRNKKRNHSQPLITPQRQRRLRNDMLIATGFLELANAGDFAANVFNGVPVALYAQILMGIGGSLSLFFAPFTLRDGFLTVRNMLHLWRERRRLLADRRSCIRVQQGRLVHRLTHRRIMLETQMEVNAREIGAELFDRFVLDSLLGIGCIIIGVGTLLAIAGNNPHLYDLSNLLSGFLGNSFSAAYGGLNLIWSLWIIRRATRHRHHVDADMHASAATQRIKKRTLRVQIHAFASGMTGACAGACSVVTAKHWQAYIPLLPFLFSSVWVNWAWRHRIAYERPISQDIEPVDKDDLIAQLNFLAVTRESLKASKMSSVSLFSRCEEQSEALAPAVTMLVRLDLFEKFCLKIRKNKELRTSIFPTDLDADTRLYTSKDLLHVRSEAIPEVLDVASRLILKHGIKQITYRERYLLEFLGAYLCHPDVVVEMTLEKGSGVEKG